MRWLEGITDSVDMQKAKAKHSLSHVRLFATPWTAAYQASLLWDSPGKNTGVGCHFLLQEIFPTQGLNVGLPSCRQTLYHLSHQGGQIACYGGLKKGETPGSGAIACSVLVTISDSQDTLFR